MKLKTSSTMVQAVFTAGLFASKACAAILLSTSGVYDEQTSNTNAVDSVAPGGAGSLSTFQANVAAAYAANLGGVIHFDEITMPVSPATLSDSTLTVTYGAGNAGTLSITHDSTGGSFLFQANSLLGTPISGATYLRNGGTSAGTIGTHNYIFSIGLSELGFTVLSRNTARNITATVTYEDGSTSFITDAIAAGAATDDTFFYFAAGASPIKSLTIADENPANFFAIDDIGFIVVPELSTALLGAASAGCFLLRRRRVR